MKRLLTLSLLLVTVCTTLLCGCSGGSPDLKGTWVNPTNSNTAAIELGETTFNSGGINFPGATLDSGANGTYEFTNDTLIVTFSNGVVEEYPMEKVDGIWELHANLLNPEMIWIKADDVSSYLDSHKVGIALPFGLAWGDDPDTTIEKMSKEAEITSDEFKLAFVEASGASFLGYNNLDVKLSMNNSRLTHIGLSLPADNVEDVIELLSSEFGFSPELDAQGAFDYYLWKYDDTTVMINEGQGYVSVNYYNE